MESKIGPLQIVIILLTAATAIIHITLAMPETLILFYLNGIGYLVLVTALYLPQLTKYKNITRWVLVAYTATTILAWIAVGARNPLAYADKTIEVALIVLLLIEWRRSR